MWDLLVSIGLNPAHIEKPQSLSSIDSKLKKPRLFKQKPLGRRMGSDGHFQGINLWWGSYFWETCFSAIAKSDDLLYCLLWGHNVVFTTIKLERCFGGRGIWQYNIQLTWKKFYVDILPSNNSVLLCHTKWDSSKVLILEVPRDVTQQIGCVTSEYLR